MKYDYAKNFVVRRIWHFLLQKAFLWYGCKEEFRGEPMRLFVTVAILGLMAGTPAMAQTMTTNTGTPTGPVIYSVPMYNGVSGATQYQGGVNGTAPIYNNATAQPLPLNQMAAGKNAPSYNYNNTRPYTGFMGGDPMSGMDYGNLTSEQRRMIDQQAAARAAQEQAYFTNMQRQQMQQQGQMNPYLQGASQLYNSYGQPEQQKPKQRRVVYNERNNPLVTPPRLFNPDQ